MQLYNTFQDYGTLYYQMEYVAGRDLWDRLHDPQLVSALPGGISGQGGAGEGGNGSNKGSDGDMHMQVGCHWSLARFYLAEAINAVEHMHRYVFGRPRPLACLCVRCMDLIPVTVTESCTQTRHRAPRHQAGEHDHHRRR